MSANIRRDKLWYWLHDQDDQVAEIDIKLDRADIEIDGLRRIGFEETKARLERLGIDTTNYRPPPHIPRSEQRCTNHLRPDDDIEALVIAATETKLDACTASTSPPARPPTRRPRHGRPADRPARHRPGARRPVTRDLRHAHSAKPDSPQVPARTSAQAAPRVRAVWVAVASSNSSPCSGAQTKQGRIERKN